MSIAKNGAHATDGLISHAIVGPYIYKMLSYRRETALQGAL